MDEKAGEVEKKNAIERFTFDLERVRLVVELKDGLMVDSDV